MAILANLLDQAKQAAVEQATTLAVGPQQRRPGDPEAVPTEIGTLYYWLVDNIFRPLQQQEAAMNGVPGLLADMAQQLLGTVGDLTGRMSQQFSTALVQLGQQQAAALAQARLDLHQEILGSAAPLLATIQQIQALDLSDQAADTAIHNQLLTALGQQSTQLQQTVQRLDTVATTQQGLSVSVNEMLTVNLGQTQDIAAVRLTQTALRSDLTATQQQLTTTTTTANAAQVQSATNAAAITQLQADVQARVPSAAVRRLTVQVPAVTITVLSPATVAVNFPAYADASYGIFMGKRSGGLLNTELGWTTQAAGSFTLTLRNTGAASLAMPAGSVDILLYR